MAKKMTKHSIGVDISKSHFDAFDLETERAAQFKNGETGYRDFRKWLDGRNITRIVYEATGAYHRPFELALETNFPLVKVNPFQARRFAEARGTRAKTDRADARSLAEMGKAFDLEAPPPKSKSQRLLRDLHTARSRMMCERVRLLGRASQLDVPLLQRQTRELIAHVERQIAELDAEIAALIAEDQEETRKLEIIRSIPGIGMVTASAILAFLPEIGQLERKQVASLAGLAPFTRSSGTWVGKSFIKGGRTQLRQALYMPALIASRFNPDLKAKYTALRAAGKPAKVALVALMRKLIELANALVKSDRKWAPKAC
jgi:transposase